jgi:tRNA(Arg) A34 adenosine deaminase TadA
MALALFGPLFAVLPLHRIPPSHSSRGSQSSSAAHVEIAYSCQARDRNQEFMVKRKKGAFRNHGLTGRRQLLKFLAVSSVVLLPSSGSTAGSDRDAALAISQPTGAGDEGFIQRALEMRQLAVDLGDQPYGAVVALDDMIIGQSWSRVILDQDPTAHAEMAAIRDAASRTGRRDLSGAILYSSSRPCPMCEAAAFWAGVGEMIYGPRANRAGPPQLRRGC